MSTPAPSRSLEQIEAEWIAAWPKALAAWSKFTRLRPPQLCFNAKEARAAGLTGSFAAIRLVDQAIVVSLAEVVDNQVEDYAVEVLAHEIGHHVLAPATLSEHARMMARMRRALPTVERHAPMVANLYTDLLINDRLQRSAGLRLDEIYRALGRKGGGGGAVWTIYVRIYELLWSLPRGSLGGRPTTDAQEGDAILGARIVRSFAHEWLRGSGRFAALLLPHLISDEESQALIRPLLDTGGAGAGGDATGLSDEDPDESGENIHPGEDPELTGDEPAEAKATADGPAPPRTTPSNEAARHGQAREPFQYGEILRAAGIEISAHEAAVRYYREQARRHLIPFPTRRRPESTDPLPEGLEPWEIGDAFDAADWIQTVLQSPHVVPGLTTVQRVWGNSEGHEPMREPLDLDLYVDCSGSMPNPQQIVSYLALAGEILCLSALRAGARVQATLWSGARKWKSTPGFVRDEHAILEVMTGFLGGGTAFPIHILRDTYASCTPSDRPVHIVVISDDGVTTMFDQDEKGHSGWDVAADALQRARGGGTLVLNLPAHWGALDRAANDHARTIVRARDQLGFAVHCVSSWPDLVEFARDFSRRRFGSEAFTSAEAERCR